MIVLRFLGIKAVMKGVIGKRGGARSPAMRLRPEIVGGGGNSARHLEAVQCPTEAVNLALQIGDARHNTWSGDQVFAALFRLRAEYIVGNAAKAHVCGLHSVDQIAEALGKPFNFALFSSADRYIGDPKSGCGIVVTFHNSSLSILKVGNSARRDPRERNADPGAGYARGVAQIVDDDPKVVAIKGGDWDDLHHAASPQEQWVRPQEGQR